LKVKEIKIFLKVGILPALGRLLESASL